MTSKTPQFDQALDEYFRALKLDEKRGEWWACRFSGKKFYIRPEDVEFYKRIRVPLPTLSPDERHRQKLAFMNSYNLFKVKSAYSGKMIISNHLPNTPHKIYEHKIWFSDVLDPLSHDRSYRDGESFFQQVHRLSLDVPQYNLYVDPASINSDYTNDSLRLKNCYLVFDSVETEDCLYGAYAYSKNSVDCLGLFYGDTCYDSSPDCRNMYYCFWCERSRNCQNSYFLYDCRNCSYCFGCTNLRNKKYYFFNESLSKEAYEARLKEINFGNYDVVIQYKKKFEELKKKAIHRPNHNEKAVNSTGDYIIKSKDCHESFFIEDSQNLAYCLGGIKTRDSYHLFAGENVENSYEGIVSVNTFGDKFCYFIEESRNLEYSFNCDNCEDCFGCVALRKKNFCIFNKQYTEDEYWRLVDSIKTKMLKDGEYGEFFPSFVSPYPYNISLATSFIGYDNLEEAEKYGYRIEEIPETIEEVNGEVIDSNDLPVDIRDVTSDILNKIIFDKKNDKKFRIIKPELDFYKAHTVPLPRENPITRIEKMRKKYGSIRITFHERTCSKCGKKFETVYSPDDPKIVYCERCYNAEVV
ncbi:hypothetical protein IIA95_03360 [Patescibacteria group bacterium]|nr:hypothetical protein [Patescibacteria group bacterium]